MAHPPGGRPPGARAAHRPPPPAGAELPRQRPALALYGRAVRATARSRPARGGDALHGPAGRLRGPARPLQRAVRPHRGHPGGGPQPARNRGAGRFFRQHPGAALRPLRRSRFRRPPRTAAPRRDRGPRPPGAPLRDPGRAPPAAAQPEPRAALPGPDQLSQPAAPPARAGGDHLAPAAVAPGDGPFRSRLDRGRRWAG